MSFVTIFYGISFYVATLILFIGLAYRIYEYATIPAPPTYSFVLSNYKMNKPCGTHRVLKLEI